MSKQSCSASSGSRPPRRDAAITLAIWHLGRRYKHRGVRVDGIGRDCKALQRLLHYSDCTVTGCDQLGQPVTKHPDANQRLSNLRAPPSKTQTTQLDQHAWSLTSFKHESKQKCKVLPPPAESK